MPKIHKYSVLAGILSGLLYFVVSSGLLVGVVVAFLPVVPLFWAGFRLGAFALTHAVIIAGALSFLLLGPSTASFLLMMQLTPVWLFGRQLLKARLNKRGRVEWYATGNAFVAVSIYAAIAFMFISLFMASGDGGLLEQLQQDMAQTTSEMDPALGAAIQQWVEQVPYILVATFIWMWMLMLYACAVFANFICGSQGKMLRHSLGLEPFSPPVLLPIWLIVCGGYGFLIPSETAFVAQTVFFILLLPYFILGLAGIHQSAQKWKNKTLWLWLFYFVLVTSQWPAFLLAGYGILKHVLELTAGQEKKP